MKGNTIKSVNLLCAIPLIFCLLVCTGCSLGRQGDEPVLTSLSLIDRNNFSETISAPERLEKFADVDFLCNQPYQRACRVSMSAMTKAHCRLLSRAIILMASLSSIWRSSMDAPSASIRNGI